MSNSLFAVEPAQKDLAPFAECREVKQATVGILDKHPTRLDGTEGNLQAIVECEKIAGHASSAVRRVSLKGYLHIW